MLARTRFLSYFGANDFFTTSGMVIDDEIASNTLSSKILVQNVIPQKKMFFFKCIMFVAHQTIKHML